jgi:endonuclease YncB( thermonuclease family)
MIRFLLLCATVFLFSSPSQAATAKIATAKIAPAKATTGTVASIEEGDRLTLLHKKRKIKILLYGIDAPELRQPHGKEAREFLASFVKGETVDVRAVGKIQKSRITGLVALGEDNINELLILNGQAWVDRATCTEAVCATWIKMEEAAKATGKGLWNDPQAIPPWEFRKTGKKKRAAATTPPAHP